MIRRIFESSRDVLLEAAWRLAPATPAPRKPSWSLDPAWLRSVTLVWPTRYQWPLMPKWVDPLRAGLARHVKIVEADIPQDDEGIVQLELRGPDTVWSVAIDCFDKARLNVPAVERSDVYFKMQYQAEGYSWPHVVPGGFGPADGSLYRFLPRLRAAADALPPKFDVYGRFGLEFASDVRRAAITRLTETTEVKYGGGAGIVRYSRFLREVARAKVCINLPGNGDLCFRLIDYFAVGACVIGPRLRNTLNVPLVDGVHIVYAKDDMSDLVPLCRHYVEDAGARDQIRRNARALFDDYLSSAQLAAYYLHTCQERLRHAPARQAVVA